VNHGQWEQKEDKSTGNSTCVCYDDLRIFNKQDCYENGYAKNTRPQTFDQWFMILITKNKSKIKTYIEQTTTAAPIFNPLFEGENL
jgi:hypothetical protein